MVQIKGFHHISAFTKSIEENLYFYSQILGLRLVKQTVHQENFQTPHLFYGDYTGTPGTLLTFFVYPKIGRSYLEDHYFGTVSLSIPKGSLSFWKNRLKNYSIEYKNREEQSILQLTDPDGLSLQLEESNQSLQTMSDTTHSTIDAAYQIIRISKIVLYTNQLEKEKQFLKDWLALSDSLIINEEKDEKILLKETNTTKSTRFGKGSIDHIALSVESLDDLEAFKFRAETLGYQVEKLIDRHYFTSLYVKSPSGLRIELATITPGFTLDEKLETLGTKQKIFKQ